MRCENLFCGREDKQEFRTIDWQTLAACSPGVEFVQLCAGFLQKESYPRLGEIYDAYLDTLHTNCPAAKAYTKEMLNEDFGIGSTIWCFALCPILYMLCEPDQNPDGP